MGEKRFGRNGRRGNDLGNELSTFGYVNLSGPCLPDPSSSGLVKFADGDRLHVTHCVTRSGAVQDYVRADDFDRVNQALRVVKFRRDEPRTTYSCDCEVASPTDKMVKPLPASPGAPLSTEEQNQNSAIGNGETSPTPQITEGQTPDQVVAILGPPISATIGALHIYADPHMTIPT